MQLELQPKLEVQPEGDALEPRPVRWSLGKRIALRFAVVYFPLFTLWIPVHFLIIPPIPQLYAKYQVLRRILVVWVGERLLHLTVETGIPNPGNGSKDTTYNYVEWLCYLGIAAAVAGLWSVLDRKRPNYQQLQKWFWLYLRLVLGVTMIQYGAAKIFLVQFSPPSLATLVEPFGDFSPMHLLWSFMGASATYTFFAGAAELLGGLLLLIPRTTTLGALVSLGALTNVLVLNFSYDVPVKIGVINLVTMAGLLLLPNLRRLADFFLFNRRVEPAPPRPIFQRKLLNQAVVVLPLLFGLALAAHDIHASYLLSTQAWQRTLTTPFYGIWSVEEFTVDGQLRPPLLTDPLRWQRLIIEIPGAITIQPMTGDPNYLGLRLDRQKKSLNLVKSEDWRWKAEFAYENPRPDVLILRGQMDGHPVSMTLHRMDESKFLLKSRGFHWVNEFSFNR